MLDILLNLFQPGLNYCTAKVTYCREGYICRKYLFYTLSIMKSTHRYVLMFLMGLSIGIVPYMMSWEGQVNISSPTNLVDTIQREKDDERDIRSIER